MKDNTAFPLDVPQTLLLAAILIIAVAGIFDWQRTKSTVKPPPLNETVESHVLLSIEDR